MILRVGTGKANQRRTIFGRAMRHVDARLCPIGALAFDLHNRLIVTKEYKDFDFSVNNSWFDRKLIRAMPQGTKPKRKRSMEEQEAIDQLKQVLRM